MRKEGNRKKLRFIALSGTTGVTENLYVYEYADDMLVIDCGVGFPDPGMYGVDLVIPDFSYLVKKRQKLRGLVITHGHEDHLGAVPFLLSKIKVPVYASELTAGFIKEKLEDYGIKGYKLNVIDPVADVLNLGVFRLTPFRVSHSVPDTLAFRIETPVGNFFHVSDYKFDWTPVDGRPFDVAKAAGLASEGVVALASDCLGSLSPGYTQSEREIEARIEAILEKAGGQVFFTTISSNISRMQQAINVAERLDRKVCFIGRSVAGKAEIAKGLGQLKYSEKVMVTPKRAGKLPRKQILYIISGSYGQPGSALYKVAMGEHQFLKVEAGDTVIFSGDPAPPGSKANVDFLVDRFLEFDADVHYYDMQEDLHVSGHGSQEDINLLFGLVRPRYYVPIGGTIRHMRGYRLLAEKMGAKKGEVLELMPGQVVEFGREGARMAEKIEVNSVLVDGLGVGDVGNVVLRDRRRLANDGIAVVIMQIDKNKEKLAGHPEIMSRGFVFEKKHKDFLKETGEMLGERLSRKRMVNAHQAQVEVVDFLEKFFLKETGRRPMVLPVVVEV
jgi:ribonuclease J